MKTLKYTELCSFDGTRLKDERNHELDFKTVVLNHVGAFPAKTGSEAVRAFALGQKINSSSGGSIDLEDAEMELLKRILEERPGFTTIVMGQLFKAIEEAK